MRYLETGENVKILTFEDNYYTCVYNSQGLLSFVDMPYLKTKNGTPTINIDKYEKTLDNISKFNLPKEFDRIVSAKTSFSFIEKLAALQDCVFDFIALNDFVQNGKYDKKTKNHILESVMWAREFVGEVQANYTDGMALHFPTEWARKIPQFGFWTSSDLYKLAKGQKAFPAHDFGLTQDRIKNGCSEEDREKYQKIFEGLNKQLIPRQRDS